MSKMVLRNSFLFFRTAHIGTYVKTNLNYLQENCPFSSYDENGLQHATYVAERFTASKIKHTSDLEAKQTRKNEDKVCTYRHKEAKRNNVCMMPNVPSGDNIDPT